MNTVIYIGKKIIEDENKHEHGYDVKCDCVKKSELPKGTRIITPDTFVTMDFDENRLNLYVNDENVVLEQRLG